MFCESRTEIVAPTIDGSLAVSLNYGALWGKPRLFRHRGSRV